MTGALLPAGLAASAAVLRDACRAAGLRVTVAESCTGGLIAGAITSVSGSSDIFDYGFVTYSNASKTALLGVPPPLLLAHGAVSAEVATAMADGALRASGASLALSVTGIAGPGGGSEAKPVGLVWFGLAVSGRATHSERQVFAGDRTVVRTATVAHALRLLLAETQLATRRRSL